MLGPARGTKVLFGNELHQKNWIKKELAKWAQTMGFKEIETPTFEYSCLFDGGKEEGENILEKELFYLEEKKYALKPEGTASVARAAISEKLLFKTPGNLKFFYFSQCFRHERPQKGRYREFTQFGLELLRGDSFIYELELISALNSFFKEKLGINLDFKVNYLSGSETKKRWAKELTNYFEPISHLLSETSQKRVSSNPIRILDDRRDCHLKEVKDAPKIQSFLSEEERKKIKNIKNYFYKLEIKYIWDENLVRGLDYYTGLVFEWSYHNLSIAGGGRYDEFFKRFEGEENEIPSIGAAIGIERLQNVLNESGFKWPEFERKKIYICNLLSEADCGLLVLIKKLREAGIEVESNWDTCELKAHFKYSEKLDINWLLIYGSVEKEKKEIILKEQNKNFKIHFSLEKTDSLIRELERLL